MHSPDKVAVCQISSRPWPRWGSSGCCLQRSFVRGIVAGSVTG
ncbi:MAG: hypothetical protein ACXWO2_04365 [Candidatus Limnocylindrales bacterium]